MRTQFNYFAAAAIATALAFSTANATPATQEANPPAPTALPVTATFSSGVNEVLKLYKGGLPAEIIVNYVNKTALSCFVNADSVIYLQQQGVPLPVITALINRNGELSRQSAVAYQPAMPTTPAPPVPADPAANFNAALNARAAAAVDDSYPAPAPYPVYAPTYYSSYDYYPYSYGYPYAYGYWPVTVGFRFGHFGGNHFVGGHFGGGAHFGGGHVGGGHFGGGHVGGRR